jgi:hypothetical protein
MLVRPQGRHFSTVTSPARIKGKPRHSAYVSNFRCATSGWVHVLNSMR